MTMPASLRIAFATLALVGAPAFAVPAAVPADALAPVVEPAESDYEDMFALASDCSVALAVMEENGAEIESEPTAWMNVLMNLGERLDRDPYMEYMFRQTEISALLQVEPEQTSNWVTATADECAVLLPAGATAHAGAADLDVSRASS